MSEALQIGIKTLRLNEPFRIAHGASTERQVLRVGWKGAVGEAPFVPYYHDDPAESVAWLQSLTWPRDGEVSDRSSGPRPARLALDILQLDLQAKEVGLPLWKHLGLPLPSVDLPCCRSLSIPTDLGQFAEKVRDLAAVFTVLKLKLGSGDLEKDEAIVACAREAAPHVTLFADANGAWTPAQAAALLPKLVHYRLAFVEQPIHHHGGVDAWRELQASMAHGSMPLYADESVQSIADIAALSEFVTGVNIKLLKAGSLRNAIAMMQEARSRKLKVLLGCMIETHIGTTAAAHLAGLAHGIDLDGHFYVANDDGEGITYDSRGCLVLPDGPGLGISGATFSTT